MKHKGSSRKRSASGRGRRLLPAVLVVVVFFAGLAILAPAPEWRWFVGFYALMSALSFSLYGLDKRASTRGGWRTSEARLHLVELLGGWPGALLAQRVFWHKQLREGNYLLMLQLLILLLFKVKVRQRQLLQQQLQLPMI